MFKIYDGRKAFYQWDLDRKLVIEDETITEVHYATKNSPIALVVPVETLSLDTEAIRVARVPNIYLQDDGFISVYAVDASYTEYRAEFEVIRRKKPETYTYSETEILSLSKVMKDVVMLKADKADIEYVDNAIEKLDAKLTANYTTNEDVLAVSRELMESVEDVYMRKDAVGTEIVTKEYLSEEVSERVTAALTPYATKEAVSSAIEGAIEDKVTDTQLAESIVALATKDELARMSGDKASKAELESKMSAFEIRMQQASAALDGAATKDFVATAVAMLPTRAEMMSKLAEYAAGTITVEELADAVAPLVNREEFVNEIANLATFEAVDTKIELALADYTGGTNVDVVFDDLGNGCLMIG